MREFGRDYDTISEALGTKTSKQVMNACKNFWRKSTKTGEVIASDILSILKQPKEFDWTEEENMRFVDAVRKHGKDYDKITEAVGTKSRL